MEEPSQLTQGHLGTMKTGRTSHSHSRQRLSLQPQLCCNPAHLLRAARRVAELGAQPLVHQRDECIGELLIAAEGRAGVGSAVLRCGRQLPTAGTQVAAGHCEAFMPCNSAAGVP